MQIKCGDQWSYGRILVDVTKIVLYIHSFNGETVDRHVSTSTESSDSMDVAHTYYNAVLGKSSNSCHCLGLYPKLSPDLSV